MPMFVVQERDQYAPSDLAVASRTSHLLEVSERAVARSHVEYGQHKRVVKPGPQRRRRQEKRSPIPVCHPSVEYFCAFFTRKGLPCLVSK